MFAKFDLKYWGLWLGVAFGFCFTVAAIVAVWVMAFLVARQEFILDSRGESASAVVSNVEFRSKTTNVRVAFDVSERGRIATHVSCFFCSPPVGEEIAIEFDPQNPTLARRAGDHLSFIVMVVVAAFCARVFFIVLTATFDLIGLSVPARWEKKWRKLRRRRKPAAPWSQKRNRRHRWWRPRD